MRSGLSISFSPVYSTSANKNKDSLLFGGSGGGFRFGADYFFGIAGIGLSSGFVSASADNTAINNFLKNSSIPPDQLLITKSSRQNMFLLVGPSIRLGNTVQLYAHAKGGLFINNAGLVSIQQRGAVREAYRNESTNKSIYPGFQTGLSLQYSIKSDVWSFGIGADYMTTRTDVMNYDSRRGNGVEGLKLSQSIRDIVAGITIRYTIFGRDQASGQASGRRLLPTVNKREISSPREVASGLPTGKRVLPTVNKREIAIDEPGMLDTTPNCGPITTKTTDPDGTTQEMTFACPKDAADYTTRTKDITNDPQTTWSSSSGRLNSSGGYGVVSGRLTWASAGTSGIVTNKMVTANAGNNNATVPGNGSINPTAGNTRQTNSSSFGTMVRLSARETGTGLATGKRARETASGLATGRRQYQPIFIEGQDEVCNPCMATAKMSFVSNNPLYNDNGMSGTNPLYSKRTAAAGDENYGGIAGADIFLIERQSGAVVAKTKTEQSGNFFFANVPTGEYMVRVNAVLTGKKTYDVNTQSRTDLQGSVTQSEDWMQLMINSEGDNDMAQKAGISTSRSNIRCKSLSIIEADLDGDGDPESIKVLANLYDGTTRDITAMSRMSTAGTVKKVTVRGWDPEKKQAIAGSANSLKEYTISIDKDNGVLLTSQYENGTQEEARSMARVSNHPNVVQFMIPLDGSGDNDADNGKIKTKSNIKNDRVAAGDVNGDGMADAIINTSRSNIKNQRVAVGDVNGDGMADAIINTSRSNIKTQRVAAGDLDGDGIIWSPKSNVSKMIQIAAGDLDGDGTADLVAGNKLSDFGMSRDQVKDHFETGDKPTQEQRIVGGALPGGSVISSAMRPGSPIGGLSIKGGKNPGGLSRTAQTNENGEFEFNDLEPGDYTFTIEQNLFLDDETIITVSGDDADNIVTSESNIKDIASRKGDVKATASQNTQSLKQTGPVKWMSPESLSSILIEADLDGDGEFETDMTSSLNDDRAINEKGEPVAQQRAGVSTSRGNIRSIRQLQPLSDGLYIANATATLNNKDVQLRIVYKSRHDTVKNSIGNIR